MAGPRQPSPQPVGVSSTTTNISVTAFPVRAQQPSPQSVGAPCTTPQHISVTPLPVRAQPMPHRVYNSSGAASSTMFYGPPQQPPQVHVYRNDCGGCKIL